MPHPADAWNAARFGVPRRGAYQRFKAAWSRANPAEGSSAGDIDRRLHAGRLGRSGPLTRVVPLASLPDGTIVRRRISVSPAPSTARAGGGEVAFVFRSPLRALSHLPDGSGADPGPPTLLGHLRRRVDAGERSDA
jgi:hypothetical protein